MWDLAFLMLSLNLVNDQEKFISATIIVFLPCLVLEISVMRWCSVIWHWQLSEYREELRVGPHIFTAALDSVALPAHSHTTFIFIPCVWQLVCVTNLCVCAQLLNLFSGILSHCCSSFF